MFDGEAGGLLHGLPPFVAFGFGAVVAARGKACDAAVFDGRVEGAAAVKQRQIGAAGKVQTDGRTAEIAAFGRGRERFETVAGAAEQFRIGRPAEQTAAEMQAVAEMQCVGAYNPGVEPRGAGGAVTVGPAAECDIAGPTVGKPLFAGVFLHREADLQAVAGFEAVTQRGRVGRAGVTVFRIGLGARQRTAVAQG